MSDIGKLFAFVSRAHAAIIHSEVSSLGIGRGMPPVLGYISDHDGCKQSDINKMGNVSPATVTVMLQSLEKNGFITRKPDSRDQRCIRIYITEKGVLTARRGQEAIEAADERFFACLNGKERAELCALLEKLGEHIEKERKKAQ